MEGFVITMLAGAVFAVIGVVATLRWAWIRMWDWQADHRGNRVVLVEVPKDMLWDLRRKGRLE